MSDDQRGGRMRGQLSADDPSGTGTTIVGGQPPGAARQPLRGVPVGLEKVLYTAAIDPLFREALLRDREAAVQSQGLALEGSELAMLRLAPEAQLASAIAALDISEGNLARRGFLRAVAGAVTLAAGSVLVGCGDKDEEQSAGIRPDDASAVRGIQPDLPNDAPGFHPDAGVRLDTSFLDSAGIRPDELGTPDGIKKNDGS